MASGAPEATVSKKSTTFNFNINYLRKYLLDNFSFEVDNNPNHSRKDNQNAYPTA